MVILLVGCFNKADETASDEGLISGHKKVENQFSGQSYSSQKFLLGDVITISVSHPFHILVTGTPRLLLNIGGATKYANYVAGHNSKSLTFQYTVQAGDNDTDGLSMQDTIDTNGGSLTFSFKGTAKTSSLKIKGIDISKFSVDTQGPRIDSITPPSNSTYNLNDKLIFEVKYDEKVNVIGAPRLNLTIGSSAKKANYLSGSGTDTIKYQYIITASDEDSNGIDLSLPIDLNSGSLKDSSGINAQLDQAPSNRNYSGVLVEGNKPIVTQVLPPADATYTPGQFIDIKLKYSESVNVTGTPTLPLLIGTTPVIASYQSGSGTDTLLFRYVVSIGLYDNDGILIQPAIVLSGGTIQSTSSVNAKLDFTPLLTPGVKVEGRQPEVVSAIIPTSKIYTQDDEFFIALNFNMNVDVTGIPRLRMNLDSQSGKYLLYNSGSGTSTLMFRYVVPQGDYDGSGIELTSPLELNGGTIRNFALTNAELDFSTALGSINTTGIRIDSLAGAITQLTPPSDKTYTETEFLDFKIKYNKDVIVTNTPRLVLDIGGNTKYADYTSGTGTNELTFRYIAQSSDEDLDGISLSQNTIDLNTSGTLKDISNNDLPLDFTTFTPNLSNVKITNIDPQITSLSPPLDGAYKEGEILNFVINTNAEITVTGTPRLKFQIGSTDVYANYINGTGTNALTFRYTVASGDNDSDGITITSPLELNGGTLKSVINKDLDLTFIPPATGSVLIDTTLPTITSVTAPTNKTYIDTEKISFTVNFSENIIVTNTPKITLTIGSTQRDFLFESGSNSNALIFSYTVTTDEADIDGITFSSNLIDLNTTGTLLDGAGNAPSSFALDQTQALPNLSLVLVDGIHPKYAAFPLIPIDKTYGFNENLDFGIQFDDIVNVTNIPRIKITTDSGDVFADYLSGSGSNTLTFRYTTVSGLKDDNGIVLTSPIDLNTTGTIKDVNGNDAELVYTLPATSGIHIDTLVPVITLNTPEVIKSSNVSSYTLSGTCSENGQLVSINIGGVTATPTCTTNTYTTASLDMSGVADSLNVAITVDHQNASSVPAVQINQTVIKDTTAPSLTSNTITSANIHSAGDKIVLALTFNENIVVTGGAPRVRLNFEQEVSSPVYAQYVSGSGTTTLNFEYTVQTGDEDANGIDLLAALDFNSATLKDQYDNSATSYNLSSTNFPTKLVQGIATRVTSVTKPTDGTYSINDTIDLILHYNQSVTITGTPRIQVAIGSQTKYATYHTGSGSQNITFRYTVVNGDEDTDGIAYSTDVELNGGTIKDSTPADSSNLFAAQNTSAVLVDGIPATVAITSFPDINIANQNTYTVSGTCSENTREVTLNIGSITVSPKPTCSSGSWSSTSNVSSLADSTSLSVTADHDDQFGNNATQATQTINKDTSAPSVSSNSITSGNYTVSTPVEIKVQFDENINVTGTPQIELNISSGNKFATYSSGSGSNELTFSYTPIASDLDNDGITLSPSIDLNSGTINDSAGNPADLNLVTTNFPNVKIVSSSSLAFDQSTQYDFGQVTVGGTKEVTFIINHSGAVSATSLSETTLSSPFQFKGGSFPGTGGTCSSSINSNCTVVLIFQPTASGQANGSITLSYNNGVTTENISRSLTGEGLSTPPTDLLVQGPSAITVNECVPFTLSSITSGGSVSNVSSNENISLIINNGTATFYQDNTCSTSMTSTSILSGTSSKTLYVSSSTAGQSLTLIFNASSLSNTSKAVTTANSPTKIYANMPPEIAINECKKVEVSLLDNAGVKTGANTSKQINYSGQSNALIYSDSFCTGQIANIIFNAYENTKFVYIKNSSIETLNINFTDASSLLTATNSNVDFVNNITWWNNSWEKRIEVKINNLDQAQSFTNMPVLVRLTPSTINYSDFNADGSDIRFTLSDHGTQLDYEIDTWNTSGTSFVWVTLPTVSASAESSIYLYHKNSAASSAQNSSNVWSNYDGVWSMNKNGANFTDQTGSGKDATGAGVTQVSGPIGNAANFNGSSSLDTGYNLAQIIGRSSTFSFWVKTTQIGDNTNWRAPGITGVEQAGGGNDIFFGFIKADGRIAVNSGNSGISQSNFVVNDNTWRYITMSRSESTGEVKFYVNGVLNGSGTSDSGYKSTNFSEFGVIADTGGTPNYFNGQLDGLRLKATVQDDNRIKAEYKFMSGSNISFGVSDNL